MTSIATMPTMISAMGQPVEKTRQFHTEQQKPEDDQHIDQVIHGLPPFFVAWNCFNENLNVAPLPGSLATEIEP